MSKNKYEIDMCNGTIMDKLISFSVPLMLSGILQLMFNAVDIIVVGRFAGSQSLAAVGSTTALINMFVNLFIGVSLGANVLAARFYASGKHKEMSETVHTAITFAAISGVVMALIGVLMAKPALELMGTPDDVINLSTLYMRIYFLGMPFFMLYNYGAAVLRAVGDTKRPLMFLIAAGIINACLNMVLVIVFNLGVAGVAIATIFSQFISCVLVLRCLNKTDASYQLRFSKLRIKGYYLKQIFQVGIPAGIQSFLGFIGKPFLALTIATLAAMYFLGIRRGFTGTQLKKILDHSLRPVGMILLVIASGGVIRWMLQDSGLGNIIGPALEKSGLPLILIAFLIAILVRASVGSSIVAMTMASGIMATMPAVMDTSMLYRAAMCCAICGGATALSHVNDAGFWLVSTFLEIDEKTTLKSWTIMETLIGVTALVVGFVISIFA